VSPRERLKAMPEAVLRLQDAERMSLTLNSSRPTDASIVDMLYSDMRDEMPRLPSGREIPWLPTVRVTELEDRFCG